MEPPFPSSAERTGTDLPATAVAPTYWAFISYSRHDLRVAQALQRRLARRRLPPGTRSHAHPAASTYTPVFLDLDGAAAHRSLTLELQAALRASGKLIVLCSPFAAASTYVNDEIRYFRSIGRDADILCVIVSGVPGAAAQGKPALECFPPALTEQLKAAVPVATASGEDATGAATVAASNHPLAASLLEETPAQWQRVMEQLEAGMMGLSIAALRQRRARVQLRRALAWGSATLTAAALVYGAAWAYILPHQAYAKDYVRRWGQWEPVNPVSAAVARQRDQSFLFVRRGAFGPLTEVRSVNRQGLCAAEGMRSIVGDAFKFTCSRAKACGARFPVGELQQEQVFDQFGNTLETLTYGPSNVAILAEAVVGCSRREGNIEVVKIQRTSQGSQAGYDRQLLFIGGDNKEPRPNSESGFGLQLGHDDRGQLLTRTLLDPAGTPRKGAFGYATRRYRYGQNGDLVESATLGLQGEGVVSSSGFAVMRATVDAQGNRVEEAFFNASDQAVVDDKGVHRRRFQRDRAGATMTVEHLDPETKPTTDAEGVSTIRRQFMDDGRVVREAYFNEAGKPVLHREAGCAIIETRTQADERREDHVCMNADGSPRLSARGVYLTRNRFDARGNEVSEAYFAKDATTPTFCAEAGTNCPLHEARSDFDERGNVVRTRAYGLHGEPIASAKGGHGMEFQYDQSNRMKRRTVIDSNGQPTRSADGEVAQEYEYDSYGRMRGMRLVGITGQPEANADGVHKVTFVLDAFGNVERTDNLDLRGAPIESEEQAATGLSSFDHRGREIERRFLDAQGQPFRTKEGYFGYRLELDAWGRDTALQFLGADGKPAASKAGGVMTERRRRDRQGHVVAERYHGADDRLVLNSDGLAGYDNVVDARGNVVARRNVGLLGQTVADREGLGGYLARFDDRGRHTVFLNLDANLLPWAPPKNHGVAITVSNHDDRGNLTSVFVFNAKGKPQQNGEGIYGWLMRHDERGRQVLVMHLNASGQAMANIEGAARVETHYDATGGVSEHLFLDIAGQPTRLQVPIVRYVNDAKGRVLESRFFDGSDKPIASPVSGRAGMRLQRDKFGRVVEELSLNVDGQPVNRRDTGWARRTHRYDETGGLAELQCFDAAQRLVATCESDN